MIKWYECPSHYSPYSDNQSYPPILTTSGRHSVFYRCLALFFLFGNHPPPKVVVVALAQQGGALLLIWKSSFFKKQTARTSKQAKTAYSYNCIRGNCIILFNFHASISKYGKNLRATESAWVDKRMCSDNQKGGASIENRTAYNYNCIRRPASSFIPC